MTSSTGRRPVAPRQLVGPFLCRIEYGNRSLSQAHGQLGRSRKSRTATNLYRSGLNGEAPRI